MKNKIVVALGGNALGDTNTDQIEALKYVSMYIIELVKMGNEVVIVHGNGPQVGKIQLAFGTASKKDDNLEEMPLPESIAMSQGYIGYQLQNQLKNEAQEHDLDIEVFTILTQVVVSDKDVAFRKPSKPIGPFMLREEIDKFGDYAYVEDSGRGYRRVVPSPLPQKIVETSSIKENLLLGNLVVCAGGGGIPVVEKNKHYYPVEAVIDKDATASLLATEIDADLLIILTAVDKVYLNYNSADEVSLSKIDLNTLDEYIKENHFAPGSMLPKIEACRRFVKQSTKGVAVITSLENVKGALEGTAGTSITR